MRFKEMQFNEDEWLRYSRQIQHPAIGADGQLRLRKAHVVIVGVGGLGCPAALYLCSAGVGKLTLIDGDRVSHSNLHRQVLFTAQQVGIPKVAAAKQTLLAHNPHCNIASENTWLTQQHADVIRSADIVLDCTDQYPARYLLNFLCKQQGVPWCFASVENFSAQTALFTPQGACYQCLYPQTPGEDRACGNLGILGALPGVIGLQQALCALKYLLRLPAGENTLHQWQLLDTAVRTIQLIREPDCPACAGKLQLPVEVAATVWPGNIRQLREIGDWQGLLVDVRSAEEHRAFNLGGTNIPLSQMEARRAELPVQQPILFYCQSGKRSMQAAVLLRAFHHDIAVLEGGLLALLERKSGNSSH